MKGTPQHHHPGVLELLQTLGQLIEFVHPTNMRVGRGIEQGVKIKALVAQSAVRIRPGGVVKVRADSDQAALLPIPDGRFVRCVAGEAVCGEIGIINPEDRRPVTRLIVNLVHQPQVRSVAEIGELAGQHTFVGASLKALNIPQNGFCPGIRLRIDG